MVFREDVDIGTLTVGDLHKKSQCMQMKVEELLQNMEHVRSAQVHLFNYGLGVQDATDDIADNLHCTRALLGEEVVQPKEKPSRKTLGFSGEVHEAMSLESLDSLPMHCDFDGVDRISTQDLSLTQFTSELQNTPMRFVRRTTPLSAYEVLFTSHLCLLLNGEHKVVVLQDSVSYACNRASGWQDSGFSSNEAEPGRHHPSWIHPKPTDGLIWMLAEHRCGSGRYWRTI